MTDDVGLCGVTMAAAPEASRRATLSEPVEPVTASGLWLAGQLAIGDPVSNVVRHGVCPLADAAQAARRVAVATLRSWDLVQLSDTVELVVSELVTNALRHGLADRGASSRGHVDVRCPVELIMTCELPHVTCVVTDPSDNVPVRRDPEELADSGRGLHVVSSCSHSWGWSRFAGGGKAVWALFHDGY